MGRHAKLILLALVAAGCGASATDLSPSEQANFNPKPGARSPEAGKGMAQAMKNWNETHKPPPGYGVRSSGQSGPPVTAVPGQ